MRNFLQVIERIKEALRVKSDADLANALKTRQSTISSWRKRENVPFANITKISIMTGIPVNWFLQDDIQSVNEESEKYNILEEDPNEKRLMEAYRCLDEDGQKNLLYTAEHMCLGFISSKKKRKKDSGYPDKKSA